MDQIQEIVSLMYVFLVITVLPGIGILFCYGFPKVRNADEIHTLLPPDQWTPEKYRMYERHDLISRFGVTFLLTGAITIICLAFLHIFI